MPLTKRQRQILNFINSFLQEHDYSPTLDEIAKHFGIASLNGVYKHLRVLEERGFIKRLSNRARSIQVIDSTETRESSTLPLLGRIAAGQPIEAISNHDEVPVPENLLSRGENYVLRVEGDSMIDEHIQDGDLIIVERRDQAINGDTVVALIDGEHATLKKFYRDGRRYRLQPANPMIDPIYVEEDDLRIQGIVVGLMRKY